MYSLCLYDLIWNTQIKSVASVHFRTLPSNVHTMFVCQYEWKTSLVCPIMRRMSMYCTGHRIYDTQDNYNVVFLSQYLHQPLSILFHLQVVLFFGFFPKITRNYSTPLCTNHYLFYSISISYFQQDNSTILLSQDNKITILYYFWAKLCTNHYLFYSISKYYSLDFIQR